MKFWYQENLRFLQTVLREPDIIDYDAKAVVAYMRAINANTLVINAGGVIDFFPNPLPMSKENRFMAGQDILKDICREIHAAGMHIVARVDFRGVEQARYEQNPDWFARNYEGNPNSGVLSKVRFYAPCYNSYYANEHAVSFIHYLLDHYEFDGIWENALVFGMGPCYCHRCQARYLQDTGKAIPTLARPGLSGFEVLSEYFKPEFDEYRLWKSRYADEHIRRLRDATKAHGHDKAYCAEIFDLYNSVMYRGSGIDHINAKRYFDFLISCVFLDAAFTPNPKRPYDIINNAGTLIRYSRALQPEKQPVICTGGNGTRTRYVADPLLETRLWLWEIASVGGGIWNTYFNGQHPGVTYDRRAAYSESDAFKFLAQNADVLSDSTPVRDVAIYYSAACRDRFADMDESRDSFAVHIRGAERVLIERHIPYGFVVGGDLLDPNDLAGIKALILPNTAVMSEKELEVIREYVRNGGGLIATFETSLYHPDGTRRENYGLSDLFGCNYAGESINTGNDYYLAVKDRSSPLLKGLGETALIMNGGRTVLCRCENAEEVAGYLPEISNQPPEYAWIEKMDSPYAGIVTNKYGHGRIAYFAHTIDALCFTDGHEDFTEIYGKAVDFVAGGSYLLTTDAWRSVHTNIIEHPDGDKSVYILSFVNTTGTSQRPLKELVPVGPISAKMLLNGKTFEKGRLLWGSAEILSTESEITVMVPRLEEFASVELTIDQSTAQSTP